MHCKTRLNERAMRDVVVSRALQRGITKPTPLRHNGLPHVFVTKIGDRFRIKIKLNSAVLKIGKLCDNVFLPNV